MADAVTGITTKPPPARSMGGVYQPQLDGLRGLAIIGVLFHHFGLHIPDFLEYGPIAVRLFFAFTGYFITLWLWKARVTAQKSGVSIWRELPVFHARRLLRIVPPYYLSLMLAAFLGIGVIKRHMWWHLLFVSNFYVVKVGYWPPVVSHLWSLSVQEQFYILWPLIILFTPRRWFLGVLTASILVAFGFRLYCVLNEVNPVIRWTMLPGSLDSFATGAFVGWLAGGKIGTKVMSNRQRWGWGVVAFVCLMIGRNLRYFPQESPWIATIELFEAVAIGWIILATAQGWRGPVGRLFSFRPLVYIGKISLGIYLYHILTHIVFGPWINYCGLDPQSHNTLRVLVLVCISIGVATLSWFFFEMPLARFKPGMIGKKGNGS